MSKEKDIPKIGVKKHPRAKKMRIVHISDTHMEHDNYEIPDGDILIHSGNFAFHTIRKRFQGETEYMYQIKEIDNFFSKLPHKYKIFVAGQHDVSLTSVSAQNARVVDSMLKHVIYLEDSFVTIEGIRIYGSPWSSNRKFNRADAFSVPDEFLYCYWSAIPPDTDVVVTYTPPYEIMDLSYSSPLRKLTSVGMTCSPYVKDHCGCPHLRETIFKIRPAAHLFGTAHRCNGIEFHENILFSNAAMKNTSANVMDYYSVCTDTCVVPNYRYPNDHPVEKCNIL